MMRLGQVSADKVLVYLSVFSITAQIVFSADNPDEVVSLPGYNGKLRSKHYSGYITINEQTQKRLFYYFVTSETDPVIDPVVLWLNGGPGCSSLDGFTYEHGPFILKKTDEGIILEPNPYTWSKVANMLYLDSPAGVGLSYSEDRHDYVTNDTQTAIDANIFLRKFFDKYSSFQKNDFYISGESYAGVYVPNLAKHVVEGNKGGDKPSINIQGYIVGNGVTDPEVDGNAFPLFALGKSLIPLPFYQQLVEECKGSFWNATYDSRCGELQDQMWYELADLNLYGILLKCYHPSAPTTRPTTAGATIRAAHQLPLGSRRKAVMASHRYWPVRGVLQPGQVVRNWKHLLGLSAPCIDTSEAEAWLDNPTVRAAIHAAPVGKIGGWELCTDNIQYTNDIPTMIPIHKQLVQEYGLRALIYNGDHDLCVPHTGTEVWTRRLGLKLHSSWRPWFYKEGPDRQVAGYFVQYEGLAYATIKGAGHMVPQTNPWEAFVMFSSFLNRAPLGPLPQSASSQ